VEVHEASELDKALACDADVFGINNRDLTTFTVDIKQTERILQIAQPLIPVISESGVLSQEDAQKIATMGVDGVLIGEYFMRQPDPEKAVQDMVGVLG
jgi:indole-3-glycerol phosphate synthase